MKIALVANTDWYLYNFRRVLAEVLSQDGNEVVMASPGGVYACLLQESGFKWLEWDVSRKTMSPLGEIRAIIDLTRMYKQQKPRLVHHSTMKPVLYGSIAARLAGVPGIVNSITGLGYIWLSGHVKARLLRPFIKWLFKFSLHRDNVRLIFENPMDQAFFISEGLARADQTVVIPGVGVDPERFAPSPELEGEPIILFPARILWDKGIGALVEASRILKKTREVRIVLAGKPDPGNPTSVREEVVQQWVREGLVEYWGWMDDMPNVYRQSQIVVLPSFYEGVPTALLEAAACERPIVATDVPGCRTIVKDGVNGYLVKVNDPENLAEALGRLLGDGDLRHKMGKAGREIILKEFTVQNINQRTISIYQNLMNENDREPVQSEAGGTG